MVLFTSESQGCTYACKAGIVLFFSFLFSFSTLMAQPPACEIIVTNGQLTACVNQQVSYTSNVSFGANATYEWDFPVNNTGASISTGQGTGSVTVNVGPNPGQYVLRLTVTTTAGTSSCESSFTVSSLTLQPSFTPVACFGSTSTLSVTSNGTNVIYTLQPLNISNTTGIFAGLTAGNYSVSAVDQESGCSSNAVVVITQPGTLMQATSTTTNNLCFGQGIGGVNLSVTGGVPPYTYSWSAANGGMIPPGQINNQDLIQLFAGNYTVSITDAAGCTIQHQATVTQPDQLFAQATANHVICWGFSTGSIDLTITGGTAPFTYEWAGSWGGIVPPGMENNEDLTGLTPGFYEVLVRDANNCTVTKSIAINGPSIGLATSYTQTNVGCAGGPTGSIDLNVSNGFPPFTYMWVGSNGGIVPPGQETLEDISGLVTGTYTCTVTDSINCTTTRTITIIQTNNGNIPVSSTLTHVTCYGGSNGAIDLTVGGNTTGLSVTWSATQGGLIPAGQQNQQDLTGLIAGAYTVSLVNGSCSASQTFVINQPSQINASVSGNPTTCGEANGSVSSNVSGGTSPYSYIWSASNGGIVPPGQETLQNLTGLSAGSYSLSVTDALGCNVTGQSFSVASSSLIQATLAVSHIVICNTATGSINLTVSGGSAPYDYEWSASGGGVIPAGQVSNEDISGLIPGTYHVVITDNSGCMNLFTAIVMDNCGGPLPCSITVTPATQNISCFGEEDGEIELTIAGGSAPITIVWTASNGGEVPGTQQGTASLTGLKQGTYSYNITSGDGCTASGEIDILGPDAPISILETHTNVACGNGTGSINITVSGGTAPYSYQWYVMLIGSIPSGQANNEDLSGLAAGIYYVRVIDANGCIKTKSIVITNVVSDININANVTQPACSGSATGAVNITPSGGNGAYTYVWTSFDGGIIPSGQETQQDVTGLVPGKYKVKVTDANGCSKTRTFNLHAQYSLHVSVQRQNVQGCGENNGSINISHTNLGGPYSYVWVASNGGLIPPGQVNQQDLTNIPAGTYTVTVTNSGGCSVTKEITIIQNCNPPSYGCGHGYWKNHTELWNQFTDPVVSNMPAGLQFITTTNFYTYFNLSSAINGLPSNLTMAQAMDLSGNNCRGMARSGVKALLVIASGQNVNYPSGTSNFTQVYNAIRNALLTGNCNGTLRHQLNNLCNSNDNDDDDGKPTLITDVIEVTAHPNPFVNEIRFNINTSLKGNASLELYSLTGEKLAVVYQGPLNSKHSITYRVPVKNRRSMVYVLRAGDKIQTGKLIYLN